MVSVWEVAELESPVLNDAIEEDWMIKAVWGANHVHIPDIPQHWVAMWIPGLTVPIL